MIGNLPYTNNVNFSGTFKIDYTRAAKGTREFIETKALNNHRQIFPNWEGNPNVVVYVTRDRKDYQMANAVYINNLKVQYFPNINTRMGFDDEMPEVLKHCLDSLPSTESIRGPKRVFNYVEEHRPHARTKVETLKPVKQPNRYQQIVDNLKLIFETKRVDLDDGIVKFVDINGGRGEVVIYPPKKDGSRYVSVTYNSPLDPERYYKFNKQNEIVETLNDFEGICKFYRGKKECIHRYRQMNNLI